MTLTLVSIDAAPPPPPVDYPYLYPHNRALVPQILPLWDSPLTVKQIAAEIGVKCDRVRTIVAQLQRYGAILPRPMGRKPPKPEVPPPPAPVTLAAAQDGHRWDRTGRFRTCARCSERQFVSCRVEVNSHAWIPALGKCVGRKRGAVSRMEREAEAQ